MISRLRHDALVDDEEDVGVTHGRQPVRDHDCRTSLRRLHDVMKQTKVLLRKSKWKSRQAFFARTYEGAHDMHRDVRVSVCTCAGMSVYRYVHVQGRVSTCTYV